MRWNGAHKWNGCARQIGKGNAGNVIHEKCNEGCSSSSEAGINLSKDSGEEARAQFELAGPSQAGLVPPQHQLSQDPNSREPLIGWLRLNCSGRCINSTSSHQHSILQPEDATQGLRFQKRNSNSRVLLFTGIDYSDHRFCRVPLNE